MVCRYIHAEKLLFLIHSLLQNFNINSLELATNFHIVYEGIDETTILLLERKSNCSSYI